MALEYKGRDNLYQSLWLVLCDCGNKTIVRAGALKSARTQSCGCLQKERTSAARTIHGLYRDKDKKRTRLSRVWSTMKERCQNPHSKSFKDYGGRGISVCSEWHDYLPFFEWAMSHGYQSGLQIDRIDNNGNYDPSNCRWATRREQGSNKRNNIVIYFSGRTLTLQRWAEELHIDRRLLSQRFKKGWPTERILTARRRP